MEASKEREPTIPNAQSAAPPLRLPIINKIHSHLAIFLGEHTREIPPEHAAKVRSEMEKKVFENVAPFGFAHCKERLLHAQEIGAAKTFAYFLGYVFSGLLTLGLGWNLGAFAGKIAEKAISEEEVTAEVYRRRADRVIEGLVSELFIQSDRICEESLAKPDAKLQIRNFTLIEKSQIWRALDKFTTQAKGKNPAIINSIFYKMLEESMRHVFPKSPESPPSESTSSK